MTSILPTSPLDAAMVKLRNGNLPGARHLLRKMTRDDPRYVEAWLWRAQVAETQEEKFASLRQALQLAPDHPQAGRLLHEAIRHRLDEDPFLAYEGESKQLYQVRTAADLQAVVPKRRATPPPYPPPTTSPVQPATRWLGWALLGLLPAGLGTLLFAPLAIRAALRALHQPLTIKERARSQIVLVAAALILALSVALALLFLLHL